MKKKKNIFKIIFVLLIITLILVSVAYLLNARYHIFKGHTLAKSQGAVKEIYYCPMHPTYTSDKPGDCPICGMKLVKKEAKTPTEEGRGAQVAGVYISPERQQFIGIKREEVQKKKLLKEVRTVGRIAYDPELFIAQREYLEALKAQENTKESSLPLIREQTSSLVEAAGQKLLLLGMSEDEIDELAKSGKAQQNLYLPVNEDTVWIYITIYEYEMGLIKKGLPVKIETVAYPGEIFEGKIISITPVLDAMTRSVNVRAEIKNPDRKLKPEMFANVKIVVDLGEKLAVSEEAVMNTGERTFVIVTDDKGYFFRRDVKVGYKTEGYYEVLDGLTEGEILVTSGNFLIDSESRLQSAVTEEHKHGQ